MAMLRFWPSGCLLSAARVEVRHYAAQQPALHGAVFQRPGRGLGHVPEAQWRVVKRFQVQIDASWQGERGIR